MTLRLGPEHLLVERDVSLLNHGTPFFCFGLEQHGKLFRGQLTADDRIPPASIPRIWKTDRAISRPIVVTGCMIGSSESWGPYAPTSMALPAGGHSINDGPMT